jgi:catechol-2,3-dioxygenase
MDRKKNKGGFTMKIEKAQLFISRFEETVAFYQDILQFSLLSNNEDTASFQIGESVLELIKDKEKNHYYYHFAFNIHKNLFEEAKQWLLDRVELLQEDGMDEIDFTDSKANSCYFEDPAGNIVEFIARRETSPFSSEAVFSPNNVLCISEMSLTTNKVIEHAEEMKEMGISLRHQIDETELNFIGEYKDGTFILLGPVGRRWLFSSKEAIASPVTIVTDRGVIRSLI